MEEHLNKLIDNFLWRRSNCKGCPLWRPHYDVFPMFGLGNLESEIAIVAESPNEDPGSLSEFDPTGFKKPEHAITTLEYWAKVCWGNKANCRALRALFSVFKLKPWEVYYTNLCACSTNGVREDIPRGIESCSGYLEEQLKLLKPRLTVSFGANPARELIGSSYSNLFEQHGNLEKGVYVENVLVLLHWSYGQPNMKKTRFQGESYYANIGRILGETSRRLNIVSKNGED